MQAYSDLAHLWVLGWQCSWTWHSQDSQLFLHNLVYRGLAQHPHQELQGIQMELVRHLSTGWEVGLISLPEHSISIWEGGESLVLLWGTEPRTSHVLRQLRVTCPTCVFFHGLHSRLVHTIPLSTPGCGLWEVS